LIHELLPGTAGTLPGPLMVRQLPATLLYIHKDAFMRGDGT
jgi:hypothetical protein